jgi:hypothetical protein
MKKWIILAYIISVLVISGMAKATETDVVIENYNYDSNLLSLTIAGKVTGNCGVDVSSVIIDSQATEDLPVLLVELGTNSDKCQITNKSNNQFDLTLDLRSLGIKRNTSYYLMFNNLFSNNFDPLFLVHIPKEISQNTPKTEQIRGILKKDINNNFYFDVDGAIYMVKSNINLDNYLNNKVLIDALKIIYQVGPGFDISSRSPLRESSENQPADFVYILGISTI